MGDDSKFFRTLLVVSDWRNSVDVLHHTGDEASLDLGFSEINPEDDFVTAKELAHWVSLGKHHSQLLDLTNISTNKVWGRYIILKFSCEMVGSPNCK